MHNQSLQLTGKNIAPIVAILFPAFAANLVIGAGSSGGLNIQAVIDDTRIYNRALDPTEISELYRMDTSSTVNTSNFLAAAP